MTGDLILLAHGSPDPLHAVAVDAIADRVHRELGPEWTVSTSYLQHHGPTVTEALAAVRTAGARPTVIQPLLLTAGEHWRNDVPAFTRDALSKPAVQLLDPPNPVELSAAVLETLSPFGSRGTAAESSGNTPMPRFPVMPIRHVLLVAGGSRIQDLRQHFKPLAAGVERMLGPGLPDQYDTQAQPISVGLLTRPAEIVKYRSSGSATQIVPLLVSTGRVYDSIVDAADQVGATVSAPIGGTTAFAHALADLVVTQQRLSRQD